MKYIIESRIWYITAVISFLVGGYALMGLAMSASMSAGPSGEQSVNNFNDWATVFTVATIVFIVSLLAILARRFISKSKE